MKGKKISFTNKLNHKNGVSKNKDSKVSVLDKSFRISKFYMIILTVLLVPLLLGIGDKHFNNDGNLLFVVLLCYSFLFKIAFTWYTIKFMYKYMVKEPEWIFVRLFIILSYLYVIGLFFNVQSQYRILNTLYSYNILSF